MFLSGLDYGWRRYIFLMFIASTVCLFVCLLFLLSGANYGVFSNGIMSYDPFPDTRIFCSAEFIAGFEKSDLSFSLFLESYHMELKRKRKVFPVISYLK